MIEVVLVDPKTKEGYERIEFSTEKKMLFHLYVKMGFTSKQIAESLKTTRYVICNKLYKYKIRKCDVDVNLHMKKERIIYIAGLFDGEGSLYVAERGIPLQLKIIWDIGMTDRKTLETVYGWLRDAGFRPKLSKVIPKGKDKRGYDRTLWKPYYRLRLYWTNEIKVLLELMKPWLINKKTIVNFAIFFIRKREWGKAYTKDDYELAKTITRINQNDITQYELDETFAWFENLLREKI